VGSPASYCNDTNDVKTSFCWRHSPVVFTPLAFVGLLHSLVFSSRILAEINFEACVFFTLFVVPRCLPCLPGAACTASCWSPASPTCGPAAGACLFWPFLPPRTLLSDKTGTLPEVSSARRSCLCWILALPGWLLSCFRVCPPFALYKRFLTTLQLKLFRLLFFERTDPECDS
jgi:hypothetical protein